MRYTRRPMGFSLRHLFLNWLFRARLRRLARLAMRVQGNSACLGTSYTFFTLRRARFNLRIVANASSSMRATDIKVHYETLSQWRARDDADIPPPDPISYENLSSADLCRTSSSDANTFSKSGLSPSEGSNEDWEMFFGAPIPRLHCGICGRFIAAHGADWPYWLNGKPVHALCDLYDSLDERPNAAPHEKHGAGCKSGVKQD